MVGSVRFKLLLVIFFVISLVYLFTYSDWIAQCLKIKKGGGLRQAEEVFRGIAWLRFNEKNALREWQEKIFKGRVLYSVRVEEIDGYLSAYSKSAASGIIYRVKFNPKKEPLVSWKWKVVNFPDKSKGDSAKSSWIEKDDYAARFYVIFPRMVLPLFKCLEYVWDKDLAEGTILTNPYFENIKIIVAESGEKNLGQWVFEERNIHNDFKRVFGREPTKVGAIAIMTDTDNTMSTAEAEYDEIKVGYKNAK